MTALANAVIGSLLLLSALHAYWGCGGNWGSRASLPQKADGALLFTPGRLACFVVASGLAAIAVVCAMHVSVIENRLGSRGTNVVLWITTAAFFLRTIGDFQYVGLFRKVRATDFARRDAWLFTPICAVYAVTLIILIRSGT